MNITEKKPTTIAEYISMFPQETQNQLNALLMIVRRSAPGAEEKIAYGMPAFYLNGPLVYFAAFKNHIGLYPLPEGIEKFKLEVDAYKTSKGAIQFPLDRPLPLDLIEKMVIFRVKQNTSEYRERK